MLINTDIDFSSDVAFVIYATHKRAGKTVEMFIPGKQIYFCKDSKSSRI